MQRQNTKSVENNTHTPFFACGIQPLIPTKCNTDCRCGSHIITDPTAHKRHYKTAPKTHARRCINTQRAFEPTSTREKQHIYTADRWYTFTLYVRTCVYSKSTQKKRKTVPSVILRTTSNTPQRTFAFGRWPLNALRTQHCLLWLLLLTQKNWSYSAHDGKTQSAPPKAHDRWLNQTSQAQPFAFPSKMSPPYPILC